MTRGRDPSADLRRANPVREADMPSPDSPKARALMERIVRTDPDIPEAVPARRWTRRRTLLVLVPIAILALGAAGYRIYRSAAQPLVIGCHGTMSRGGDIVMVPGPGDPVRACAVLWKPGGSFNPNGDRRVPLLEACLLGGADHVFPHPAGVDACRSLRLVQAAPFDRHQADEAAAAARVRDALANESLSVCDTKEQGIAFARRALRDQGLSGWKIQVVGRPFTDAAPCASAAVDVQKHVVVIAPVRRIAP